MPSPIKDIMDDDTLHDSMVDFLKCYIQEQNDIKAYINTPQFIKDFDELKCYLKTNESYQTIEYYGSPTEEEIRFSKMADTIFRTLYLNVEYTVDIDTVFPTVNITYDGVVMVEIQGQGCINRFWLVDP